QAWSRYASRSAGDAMARAWPKMLLRSVMESTMSAFLLYHSVRLFGPATARGRDFFTLLAQPRHRGWRGTARPGRRTSRGRPCGPRRREPRPPVRWTDRRNNGDPPVEPPAHPGPRVG